MAIFGSLGVLQEQVSDSYLFEGISFLMNTDLGEIFKRVSPDNKEVVEIDGKNVYAIFQEYDTKLPEAVKMEGHEKYIDIQFIYEGNEQIDICGLNEITESDEYNDEKDIYFPEVSSYSSMVLNAGYGAILFPEDIHGPARCIGTPGRVKKVVIKVSVE